MAIFLTFILSIKSSDRCIIVLSHSRKHTHTIFNSEGPHNSPTQTPLRSLSKHIFRQNLDLGDILFLLSQQSHLYCQ